MFTYEPSAFSPPGFHCSVAWYRSTALFFVGCLNYSGILVADKISPTGNTLFGLGDGWCPARQRMWVEDSSVMMAVFSLISILHVFGLGQTINFRNHISKFQKLILITSQPVATDQTDRSRSEEILPPQQELHTVPYCNLIPLILVIYLTYDS